MALITTCACDLLNLPRTEQHYTKTVLEHSIYSAAIDCVDFDQPSWQQFFELIVKLCVGGGAAFTIAVMDSPQNS